ncbi:Outer membrane protein OmpA [Halopseudomonas formosensis]|uniref:Outer membrane protein OmpA n=1 Tax=Halopseudomonas formosensis TaxID=1002526 RepID=A0A1I6C2J9_9GAMM|nr:OmpA family protein [Halopseudomonas formosensis]SFQ87399.1 Outer membrane protein OmpA [Halopseudomonas formosensis]
MGIAKKVTALCALALLTACANLQQGDGEPVRQPSDFDDVAVVFKDLGPGYVRQGAVIPVPTIAQVSPGLSREEVRALLGNPVKEVDQRWWVYNISLPLAARHDYLVCQYGIAFDPAGQVTGTRWRRPQCDARYHELLPPASQDVEEITLFSDVLFDFDSATLSSEGLRELDLAAQVVTDRMVELERIVVVGHTDRIGAEAYNDSLSMRRAEAVRRHLVQRGIDGSRVFAEGKGAREPLIECQGRVVTAALKQCLQPNRRVQIMIYGQR